MPHQRVQVEGYLTPDDIPSETVCRSFSVPNSPEWLGNFMGSILPLTYEESWRKFGTLTPAECAAFMQTVFDDGYFGTSVCSAVETPYWDTASDVDDNAPADEQTWYGQVTDASAPAGELSWFENAAIWTFTGLLAVSASPAAAIAFLTVAPKFVIAQRAGDVAEVIRIVVDAQDIATIDTTGRSGAIISTPVVADPANETHQVYVIKVS